MSACAGPRQTPLDVDPGPDPAPVVSTAGTRDADQAMALTRVAEPVEHVATRARPEPKRSLRARAKTAAPTPAPAVEPPPVEPIEIRMARQRLTIHTAPRADAPLRGRIPLHHAFEVFALVEGPGCAGKGWADVGNGGYVCLEQSWHSKRSKLQTLPRMRDRDLTPYYYASIKKGEVAHRWASVAAYHAGAEPIDDLDVGHDYAFVTRRRSRGELLLIDERGRVVPESQVHRYRPSRFEGRDLLAEPVPEHTTMAWAVSWPETEVFAAVRDETPSSTIGYQDIVYVDEIPAAPGWYRLADGSGFVPDRDLGRFVVPRPLDGVAADEIWVDVELDEQVLTVLRGETPIFATLVSSGHKAPTPRGIFRIHHKQAEGSMSSDPGDDDPYAVEAVPHVQYFAGGFALHSAYWHNRFGRPISHGCVNLSPRDAAYVFSQTGPELGPGWVEAFEHERNLGTTVRIRRGNEEVRDKRKPVEPVFG